MSFDRDRVQFSEEELDVGEAADALVDALKDGPDIADLTALLNVSPVSDYLRDVVSEDDEGNPQVDKAELAKRLFALAAMLIRDNV